MPGTGKLSELNVFDDDLWAPFLAIQKLPAGAADGSEREIRDLLHAYCYRYDAGDLEGVIDLFTEDALLVNAFGTHRGEAALRANYADMISNRAFGFHYLTNVSVRVAASADEAVATSYLFTANLLGDGRVTFVSGSYVDRLIKAGTEWRISERRITANIRFTARADESAATPAST